MVITIPPDIYTTFDSLQGNWTDAFSWAPQKENTLNLSEFIIPIFTDKETSQGNHEKSESVPGWAGTRHHSNTVKTPRCCEGATPTPSRVQAGGTVAKLWHWPADNIF